MKIKLAGGLSTIPIVRNANRDGNVWVSDQLLTHSADTLRLA